MMFNVTDDIEELSEQEKKHLKSLKEGYDVRELNLTPEQQEFIDTKLSSKLWRLNNLYKIRDKDGKLVTLKLNDAQLKVIQKYRHNKKIILKSRQQGISTMFLAYNLDDCLFKSGYSAGIQSYGLDESQKLSMRADLMWDELDENIKQLFGLNIVMNNQKGMAFSNGSILKIGNFRGDTLQSLHVSELAKIAKRSPEKAKELKTGAFQAVGQRNKITVESTAEGKSGLFYEMWARAELKAKTGVELGPFDFEAIFLSWLEDDDCNINTPVEIDEELNKYFNKIEKELDITITDTQKWWYAAKQEELGEDMQQEYPTTAKEAFEQSVEGTYYKHQFKKLKIRAGMYDEHLLVHSAMDLGMNDTFSIGFFQKHDNGEIKIIGEYCNSDHGLEHYWDIFCALTKKFGWKHGQTYVPHDSKVKELIADKTRWVAMKELGFKPVLVKKHSLQDGIEATRQFLNTVEVDPQCETIISAIQNYRKKYDKTYQVYLDNPVHDEHSHPADMVRYLAMGDKHNPMTKNTVLDYKPKRNRSLVIGHDV